MCIVYFRSHSTLYRYDMTHTKNTLNTKLPIQTVADRDLLSTLVIIRIPPPHNAGVKSPICAVSGAQYLTPAGWMELRSPIDTDVPFRLFRDEGRTFLQVRFAMMVCC